MKWLVWILAAIGAVSGWLASYQEVEDLDHPVDFVAVCVVSIIALMVIHVARWSWIEERRKEE